MQRPGQTDLYVVTIKQHGTTTDCFVVYLSLFLEGRRERRAASGKRIHRRRRRPGVIPSSKLVVFNTAFDVFQAAFQILAVLACAQIVV